MLYTYIKRFKDILRNYIYMRYLVFILVFLSFLVGKTQQPSCFLFAEEQFKGVQIYDVIQDKKLNYWFATNEGLFYFNYYTYQKVECDVAIGNSFFNFVINKEGTIYCYNLNNQVFEIKEKHLQLFYELSDEERNSDISLSIADDNNLLIGAKKIIVLNKEGKKQNYYNYGKYYLGSAFTSKDGLVQYHLHSNDSIVTYSKGKFSKHKLQMSVIPRNSALKFYKIENAYFALNLKTKVNYQFNPVNYSLTELSKNELFARSESVRIYENR